MNANWDGPHDGNSAFTPIIATDSCTNMARHKLSTSVPSEHRGDVLFDLVNSIDAMLAYWDESRTCVFANAAYRSWFGKEGRELIGISMRELLGPLYEMNLPHIDAAFAGHKQIFERDIPTPYGLRHSLATYIPHIVAGKVVGIFVHVTDVSGLKKLQQELKASKEMAEQRATHDYLTGLPNRAMMNEVIHMAIAQSRRRDECFAVLTIDLDNFKFINDTYGHAEGDRFLIEIARRISTVVREGDTLLRLGGDEFVLIAINTASVSDAEDVAKRVLGSIGGPFSVGDSIMIPGLSIGIALYPRHGTTAEALTRASDKAMYSAKRAGKNGFAVAVS